MEWSESPRSGKYSLHKHPLSGCSQSRDSIRDNAPERIGGSPILICPSGSEPTSASTAWSLRMSASRFMPLAPPRGMYAISPPGKRPRAGARLLAAVPAHAPPPPSPRIVASGTLLPLPVSSTTACRRFHGVYAAAPHRKILPQKILAQHAPLLRSTKKWPGIEPLHANKKAPQPRSQRKQNQGPFHRFPSRGSQPETCKTS